MMGVCHLLMHMVRVNKMSIFVKFNEFHTEVLIITFKGRIKSNYNISFVFADINFSLVSTMKSVPPKCFDVKDKLHVLSNI